MPFFDKETIYSTTKRVDHRQHIDVIIIDYFKSTGDATDAYATYAEIKYAIISLLADYNLV